ncbi:MAG: hypothetical protein HY671_08770 [Chloroflexi bacterium]|nr:hypothetical protein [Chloroflexota bacterium]
MITDTASQPALLPWAAAQGRDTERRRLEAKYQVLLREDSKLAGLVSYTGNKKVPLLRLYRYKEAFSLEFVNRVLDRFNVGSDDFVFDPFAGMGTTVFAAMLRGVASAGVEKLPVATFVARTLPTFFEVEPGTLVSTLKRLAARVDSAPLAPIADDVPLVRLAFDPQAAIRLRQWKGAIDTLDAPLHDVFLLLFLSILEPTSLASNDGQFMRLKPDKKPLHPDIAIRQKVEQAENDLLTAPRIWPKVRLYEQHRPHIVSADSRDLTSVTLDTQPTVLITSPPYVNRYDYTRSYCLELCFHFVKDFQELRNIRRSILRSHIESKTMLDDSPPHPAVAEVVRNLAGYKLNNPRIPYMITAYFVDMAKVIREWHRVLAPGARVAMVVDNVRFEGEMLPVDLILSEMADAYGFSVEEVLVARYKGNSSQQMGKYGRVPVRESVVFWRKR